MNQSSTTMAAVEAAARGFQPIPLLDRLKKPALAQWTRQRWAPTDDVKGSFETWFSEGKGNVGVLLGEPSGGLVDVDIDHPKAARLKDFFLPPTPAMSGREGRPRTHYWYLCEEGTTPGSTRQHFMPPSGGKKGPVSIELRSTLGQTVIPPSIHPSGELYTWSREPWGGDAGPSVVNGRVLAARVAMIGLGAVLLDNWPQKGSRHEAYLALAGGLLSYGDMGVHPFWGDTANAAEQLIRALAEATLDDDGPDARVAESIHTTMKAIRAGHKVVGLGTLVDIIGEDHVKQVRLLIAEVEQAAGFVSRQAPQIDLVHHPDVGADDRGAEEARQSELAATPLEERDPLGERLSSWQPVDLLPYLSGQVKSVAPSVLQRDDGAYLMYPGRVNMVFGSSESAKSWVALKICLQEMSTGQRAMFVDLEDEPVNTLERMKALGASNDDLQKRFTYIRPEDPLSAMQRDRWGKSNTTSAGADNQNWFDRVVEAVDPTLIVIDGMTVLYGLHGLNTNDTSETDVITSWLKSLTRNGRSTVIVIDHTAKGAEKGSMPIGSQHKVSMVQGTLLQAWMIKQPMPGAVGKVDLVVMKDRPGQVRAISQSSGGSKAQVAATVTMDSTMQGTTVMTISAPVDPAVTAASGQVDLSRSKEAKRAQAEADVRDRIVALFNGDDTKQMSLKQIAEHLPEYFTRTTSGTFVGMGKKAVEQLTGERGGGQTELVKLGSTKNTTYKLIMGFPDDIVPDAAVDDDDGGGGFTLDLTLAPVDD